jgi:hypothetical protein
MARPLPRAREFALDPRERYADAVEFAFELEHGSLRAVPQSIARTPLYERNPVRFWQMVCAILLMGAVVRTGTIGGITHESHRSGIRHHRI